jgi:hypothetical protein
VLILSELTSMAMLGHKAAREPYLAILPCIFMHNECARPRAWIGHNAARKPAGLCVASCAGRVLGRCADFELIRLKWAEKARLNAEREELLAQLEAALSPEVADQVQAIMVSMKDELRGSLRRAPSAPTQFANILPPSEGTEAHAN